MPWKGEKDPYKVWLSEIILQQTRVDQGLAYYQRFIARFPDIHLLAKAKDQVIFKLWEGLGYYTRCRNLISAARYISKELNGTFPSNYDEIKALKGVGPYTAAAISSFAFNLPYPVIDGNVYRVLCRVFGITKPIDSAHGKNYIALLANELLDRQQPGTYNQAIMDFGATVCKPVAPNCSNCVFKKTCFAFLNNKTNVLPVKAKKISIKKRWFYYLIIEHENEIAIQQRTGNDIWKHLYEFPLIEKEQSTTPATVLRKAETIGLLTKNKYQVEAISPAHRQQLTHQLIAGHFIKIRILKKNALKGNAFWIRGTQQKKFAFPKLITQYLAEVKEATALRK